MYVCICNALTEDAVRRAAASEPSTVRVRDIYGRLGCAPSCGLCSGEARRVAGSALADSARMKLAAAE